MVDMTPLYPHIGPALMVLFRLSGLFIFAPVLGSPMIPPRVKALLVLTLTASIYATMIPMLTEQDVIPMTLTIWDIAPRVAMELVIGLIIGFVAGLPLIAVQLGGLTMGQQLGMGLARTLDPITGVSGNVLGQILFYMALVTFLMLGGISEMFRVLLLSFTHIPLGGFAVDLDLIDLILGVLTSAYELALRIAAPVLCLIFLQTFALGFISKTATAFNIMSMGFPLRVMLGSSVLIASLAAINDEIANDVLEGFTELALFIGGG